ncbi:hypothetical protein CTAYLR_008177 [Chrysophaeum taylorii]|uniref:Menorin-like domain-containing protein n=1 Tax=Chrysophaeum taylorii TaxID=2483200 RepID=A0AAD7U9N2_9STRA|nr:hypothetical protein CTAYLR_008177 [Chrysophaeum taylorii]
MFVSSASQTWVHSCCSVGELCRALEDSSVSAIESDIIMASEPVMAHPPATASDLSFAEFLERCVSAQAVKHLKLDFKDPAAVVPCLELVKSQKSHLAARGQCVWLNADVLPGPGVDVSLFDGDDFVRTCTKILPTGVLSLGWRVDLGRGGGYEAHHVDRLLELLERHELLEPQRVVVTANLRLSLLGEEQEISRILDETPCEVLLWTGTGEPAVSQALVDAWNPRRQQNNRLGFDVKVAESAPAAIAANLAFAAYRLAKRFRVQRN